MALDPENRFLFSADTKANGIWTHEIDPAKGTLTRARFKAHSENNARPRRLVMHPNSKFLYMLLSKLNKIVVYNVKMDASGPQLSETGLSYNLVPPGQYLRVTRYWR
jgi:carboxy-cis,cis-muconate cyclase